MSELTLSTNMTRNDFGFVFTNIVDPERVSLRDVPAELRRVIQEIVEGRGFDLRLIHGGSVNQVLDVVFYFRSIDPKQKSIKGTVVVSAEKLEDHLDKLGIAPKRAFRDTFSPLLDTDLTLYAELRLYRGNVMAKVSPKPNLTLIVGGG